MSILTHGSDLSLAPTLAPLLPAVGNTVAAVATHLAKAGFNAIQLDATVSGIRPRELSRRARLDLQAMIARRGLRIAGIDLFIPRQDYIDPARIDRAMAATLAGIEMAADLGRIPISLALPIDELGDDSKNALAESADGHGVTLAIHAEDQLDSLITWIQKIDQPHVRASFDPAALLDNQNNPIDTLHQCSASLGVARLSDLQRTAGLTQRCPAGDGELDLMQYRIALDLAKSRRGPVILDTRGLNQPWPSLPRSQTNWDNATFQL